MRIVQAFFLFLLMTIPTAAMAKACPCYGWRINKDTKLCEIFKTFQIPGYSSIVACSFSSELENVCQRHGMSVSTRAAENRCTRMQLALSCSVEDARVMTRTLTSFYEMLHSGDLEAAGRYAEDPIDLVPGRTYETAIDSLNAIRQRVVDFERLSFEESSPTSCDGTLSFLSYTVIFKNGNSDERFASFIKKNGSWKLNSFRW